MWGMWGLMLNYFVTAALLRAVTPAFGKFAAQEAKLEVSLTLSSIFLFFLES
jgi:hypothetical protein